MTIELMLWRWPVVTGQIELLKMSREVNLKLGKVKST